MEAVAVPRAGRVTRGGDGNALVRRHARSRELREQPAIGELVVEHDGIAEAARLAHAAEAVPDGGDPDRPEQRRARGFVEHLESLVNDLDVLRRADLPV